MDNNYYKKYFEQTSGTLPIETLNNINIITDPHAEKFLNLFYGFYTSKSGLPYNIKFVFNEKQTKLYDYLYNERGEIQVKVTDSIAHQIYCKDLAVFYCKYRFYMYYKKVKDYLPLEAKKLLYKACIQPTITYKC